ncbi:MAG: phage tail tape measure protein [Lachnospira sp.]|nr:phage tail tape measure protein [Lachnospira sp.]
MASSKRTEYEIAIQVGGKVAASFGNSMKEVNSGFDSMVNMAKSAAKMVAVAFSAVKVGEFVTDAVEVYSEFEQSMANTAAVANATQHEYEQLEEAAREMGKATTKTAAEASDALGYMMLAGWDVNDAISGLEPVLRLSEATQMDLATCSDLVTDSMSALGLSVEDLTEYLDICTAANNNANTSAEALMEAFIGCGGTARTAGASLNDTATALGILANNGTKGAEAGTALNSMLVRMTSKDVAINAMKDLGVAVFNDAGEFRGLQTVLVDVQEALSGLTAEEQSSYMASIAGTNYYTEMSYLLDAVAEKADGTASAWDTLSVSLEDSDGALMNMANTVTDTLQGAFSRLNSAADDAKISLADAFSDDLKGLINGLAEYIPTLTQKFIDFSTKAGPKISKAFRTIQKGAGDAWKVISNIGGWILDNFDAVQVAIVGIGSAIVAYKVINGIIGMANAFKSMSLVLTNPWLVVLVGVAAAIVGIASAIKTAEKQAAKSNLAAHFGDIALSMEEISEAAEHIIASDNLTKIHESMAAFDELDGIADSMQDSINAINKMNWKVSIGMELSADDKDSYVAEIQNYIEQAQSYVEQERYALNLNLALFADGDLERQNIVTQLDTFYADKYSELEALGTKLNETVTAAFEDGLLDMDEVKEITELQAQMARIQEALATSDFDAQLKVMELQYSGAELDADSFQALQEELAAQVEAASAEYEESLQLRIANYQVMLDDGAIDKSQYDAAVNEFWEDYLTSMSELEAKSLDFQINTIMQQYCDDVDAFQANMNEVMAEFADDVYSYDWTDRPVVMMDSMIQSLYDNDISKDTKQAIAMLLESMQPSLEQVEQLKQQYENLGMEIPKSIEETLANADMLGAMTAYKKFFGTGGDIESVWKVAESYIVNDADYEAIEQTLRGYGWELPEAVAEELETSQTETIAPAIDGIYAYSDEYINQIFSQGFDITTDVNVTLNPIISGGSAITGAAQNAAAAAAAKVGMPGHAEGGIFDKPHVAWFAEDGPEAAIPIDGSSNAVSLWERVGKLLGVFDGGTPAGQGEELYNGVTNYQTTNDNSVADDSTDSRQFVFSPQIEIQGSASREDVEEALNLSMEQFRELMEQYIAEKSRVSFA